MIVASTDAAAAPAERLRRLLSAFESTPVKARRLVRWMLESDEQAFRRAALEVLKTAEQSRGLRYLVALLTGRNLLIPMLCDPELSQQEAFSLARLAMRANPMLDVELAKTVADFESAQDEDDEALVRLVQILDAISSGRRLMPFLGRLMRHPCPHLRSKAVLMMGQSNRTAAWLRNRLEEPDARTRANAVESFWGVDDPSTRQLLRAAARDSNNRVAGNALVALYRIGDSSAIRALLELASRKSPLFRATAAWAMGETMDGRFAREVRRLAGDVNVTVRRNATAALERIESAAPLAPGELRLMAWFGEAPETLRRIEFVAADRNGRPQSPAPAWIAPWEDDEFVAEYEVEAQPAPEPLTIAFVAPETPGDDPFCEGALRALEWKRAGDVWWALPYLRPGDQGGGSRASLNEAAVQFTASPDAARRLLTGAEERIYFPDIWSAMRSALNRGNGPVDRERRIIAFNAANTRIPRDFDALADHAESRRIPIRAISLLDSPELEELCRRTDGVFRRVASPAEVPAAVERAHCELLARRAITYPALVPSPARTRLRVHTPAGWAEAEVMRDARLESVGPPGGEADQGADGDA